MTKTKKEKEINKAIGVVAKVFAKGISDNIIREFKLEKRK